jgi:hypothetical protein
MPRVLVPLLLCALGMGAQDLLPPEVVVLARIRAGVREMLDRLPDCTCLETVTRLMKPPGKKASASVVDTVVLQILFSGGHELFASPGDTRWEDSPLDFTTTGLMGNGVFALHLRSVFLSDRSVIKYHGMESSGSRDLARYDFSMSRLGSSYQINQDGVSARVATSGSFWADPRTYDLDRLEIDAVEIPPELHYTDISTAISYNRVRMGESDFLLPQEAYVEAIDGDGRESRNRIEFTHCRGFQIVSNVRFGPHEPPPPTAPALARPPMMEEPLPEQLRVTVALAAPVNDRSPVGSLIEGTVIGGVVHKDKTWIQGGARIQGRLRRVERYADSGDYFIVAMEFTRIEVADRTYRFYADLEDVDRREGAATTLGSAVRDGPRLMSRNLGASLSLPKVVERVWTHEVPGVGTFFVHGSQFSLPAGFQTVWKTRLFPQTRTR